MKNDKVDAPATQHNNIVKKSQAAAGILRKLSQQPVSQITPFVRKIGRNMDIARSKSVAHFAPHRTTTPEKSTPTKKQFDIGPVKHPLAAKVEKVRSQTKLVTPQPTINTPPKTTKETIIAETFNNLNNSPKKAKKNHKRNYKLINIVAISITLLLIAACLVFISMPTISVGIAGAQAGIKATYPEYCPDGYSLSGPVSYGEGQVTINFHANTGNKKFTIKQSRSSWDSSVVKDKVNVDSNGEFITTKKNGLTIYTFNGNAAWVNGGILYTITGDAPLSGDQIRRIATSL